MALTGYPTPDAPDGDVTYSCIPIVVPDNEEFQKVFAAAIYGLYGQMANEWFWREQGTLSPELAALYSSYALAQTQAYAECGVTMTCEQVADCIESEIAGGNTELINSLTQNMINNGFGNPNRINPALTTVLDRNPVGALQEDIKPLANCDMNALWGGIRHGIVERLDDNARDLLEDLAAIPNTLERLAVFVDVVPIMGDIVEGVAFQITEVIPDLLDLFDSFSSLEALDTIACEIFAIVCAECRYPTFEEVFNVYFADSLSGLPALASMTLNDIAQALLDIATNPAAIAYNTMLVWELFTLNAQAAFNGQSGTKAIIKMAEIGEDFGSDNWLDICEACDESYARWTWDFTTQGIGEFYPDTAQNTSKAVFVPGVGWRAVNHSTGRRFDVACPVDPTWEIRAVGYNVVGATDTGHNWIRRPTWGSTTGQQNSSGSGLSCDGFSYAYDGYASLTGYNEIVFFAQFAAGADAVLDKVTIIYNRGKSPSTAISTADNTIC